MAEILEIFDDDHIKIKWLLSGNSVIIPFNNFTVQSLDSKRKRKRKFNDDVDFLQIQIEKRLNKEKKKLPLLQSAKVFDGERIPDATHPIKRRDISIDNLLEEIRSAETLCEESLSVHCETLKPFVSMKVDLRLIAAREKQLQRTDTEASDGIFLLSQPKTIRNVEMRDYQLYGLSWMYDRYKKAMNCILADEMGLGKTLQTISFLAYLKESKDLNGPFLVVVPLSVMFNWIAECKKFCPSFRVFRLHTNNAKESKLLKEKLTDVTSYDICITSYETIKSSLMEYSIQRTAWRVVVLDEGHRIKNSDTQISKSCLNLRSK